MVPKPKTDSKKHVKTMFENGDWSTKINQEKQVNHMESTRKPGKAIFITMLMFKN